MYIYICINIWNNRGQYRGGITRAHIFIYIYDDNDNGYFILQHAKGFHNLVYMSYVKHINPASKAEVINTYQY
jgi:hypothetical protein